MCWARTAARWPWWTGGMGGVGLASRTEARQPCCRQHAQSPMALEYPQDHRKASRPTETSRSPPGLPASPPGRQTPPLPQGTTSHLPPGYSWAPHPAQARPGQARPGQAKLTYPWPDFTPPPNPAQQAKHSAEYRRPWEPHPHSLIRQELPHPSGPRHPDPVRGTLWTEEGGQGHTLRAQPVRQGQVHTAQKCMQALPPQAQNPSMDQRPPPQPQPHLSMVIKDWSVYEGEGVTICHKPGTAMQMRSITNQK